MLARLPRLRHGERGNMDRPDRAVALLLLVALAGCRDKAPPPPAAPAPPPMVVGPAGAAPREPVVVEDVVETDPGYIIGSRYPLEVNRYPGLAAELRDYSEAARQDLMDAVAAMGDEPGGLLYDL